MRFRISLGSGTGGRISIFSLQKIKKKSFRWKIYEFKNHHFNVILGCSRQNSWSQRWLHWPAFFATVAQFSFLFPKSKGNGNIHTDRFYITFTVDKDSSKSRGCFKIWQNTLYKLHFEFRLHCLKKGDEIAVQQESNCNATEAMLPKCNQSTHMVYKPNSNGWGRSVLPFLPHNACYG